MFSIKVSGDWGSCYPDKDGEPVFSTKRAIRFKTRQMAAEYIMEHFKDWEEVASGKETMRVVEI